MLISITELNFLEGYRGNTSNEQKNKSIAEMCLTSAMEL